MSKLLWTLYSIKLLINNIIVIIYLYHYLGHYSTRIRQYDGRETVDGKYSTLFHEQNCELWVCDY